MRKTALASAHTPSQTSTSQRVPRLSRGMTTGTSAPWSPPRSSAATSPQPASASLIELVRAPRVDCTGTGCSATAHLLLGATRHLGGRRGVDGDRATDLLDAVRARHVVALARGHDLHLCLLRWLEQVLDAALPLGDARGDLLAARGDRRHVLLAEQLPVGAADQLAGDREEVDALAVPADPHHLRQRPGQRLQLVEHVLLVGVLEDLRRERRTRRAD